MIKDGLIEEQTIARPIRFLKATTLCIGINGRVKAGQGERDGEGLKKCVLTVLKNRFTGSFLSRGNATFTSRWRLIK